MLFHIIQDEHLDDLRNVSATLGALIDQRERHHFLVRKEIVEVLTIMRNKVEIVLSAARPHEIP
jgi:hypothetical protein